MSEAMLMLGGPAHGRVWRGKHDVVMIPLPPEQVIATPFPEPVDVPLKTVEYRVVRVYSAVNEPPVVMPVLLRSQDEPRAADLLFDYLLREWVDAHG